MTALEARVGQALKERGWTLAVGESCTGGLLSHRLTQVPGSSAYFLGGVVAYSNPAKQALLGVDELTLAEHGAVSAETAKEMARGARSAFLVHVGVSVTGIAGPDGGTPDKPVGLTYIGVVTPEGERVERYLWSGAREANKLAAAEAALELLLQAVQGAA
jgi:nicotinamide-nucleotide amidase